MPALGNSSLAPPGPLTFCNRTLALAPLRAIGRTSYGPYLYHVPISHNLIHSNTVHPEGAATNALLAVTMTFSVVTASYWLSERPILKYAGRFRQRQSAPPPWQCVTSTKPSASHNHPTTILLANGLPRRLAIPD